MLLSKKTIRTLGLIMTILAIIAIILAGIQYKFAGPHFRSNPFHAIPQLQVACIIFSFFVLILSVIAFAKPNIYFTIIVAVLMLVSLLWNIAVAVYSIVGGSPGWANTYEGCQMKYNGVMGVFHNIDTYLQELDQTLCSEQCPCFITNTSGFASNSTVSPFYNLWSKTNLPLGAVTVQNCTDNLRQFAYKEAVRRDSNFDPDSTWDSDKFHDYMSNVEKEFQCSGWCQVNYLNPNYNSPVLMSKYLFTNINNGVPLRFGCLNELMQWLPGYLQAFGAVTMVLVGTQIALLAFLLCQAWAREADHEKQIPHHHDDNRQTA